MSKFYRIAKLSKLEDFEALPRLAFIERVTYIRDPVGAIVPDSKACVFIGIDASTDSLGRIRKRGFAVDGYHPDIKSLKNWMKGQNLESRTINQAEDRFQKYELAEGEFEFYHISDKPLPTLKVKDFLSHVQKKSRPAKR